MRNIFIDFWNWLGFGKKKPKVQVGYPLKDFEDKDAMMEGMKKKLASYDAQLSKISAEKKQEESEEEVREERDKKILERVKEQVKEIEEKKYGGTFSFNRFYNHLFKLLKIGNNIELVDKDDIKVFGKFGEFLVLPDSNLAITTSEGELMAYGPTLRHIIHKPESLGNQVRRGRILLPCDKDRIFFPDIEEHKLPELTYNYRTGKIKWARVSEKELKKLIIDREQRIASDSAYIERLESSKAKLVKNYQKAIREIRILKDNQETSRVELSKSIALQGQYYQKLGTLQNKIVNLEEKKKVLENLRMRLEDVNKKLLKMVGEKGAMTELKKAQALIQQIIEWDRIHAREKIVIKEEKKPETQTP